MGCLVGLEPTSSGITNRRLDRFDLRHIRTCQDLNLDLPPSHGGARPIELQVQSAGDVPASTIHIRDVKEVAGATGLEPASSASEARRSSN